MTQEKGHNKYKLICSKFRQEIKKGKYEKTANPYTCNIIKQVVL